MSARHTLKIDEDVQKVLAAATVREDSLDLPAIDPGLYKRVKKVLLELGVKWNGKTHTFAPDKRAGIAASILGTEVQREKVIKQAYYSPEPVAAKLAEFVDDLRSGQAINLLEPSAGGGALITAWLKQIQSPIIVQITAVDIDPEAVKALRAKHQLATVVAGDFLKLNPTVLGRFDVVLQNGPFQRGQALRHVSHAIKFVRPGGVFGSIVPENFPELVDGVRFESESLGAGAFKESGTNVATKMIRVAL
jgi:SAM-dependent methyltransferase